VSKSSKSGKAGLRRAWKGSRIFVFFAIFMAPSALTVQFGENSRGRGAAELGAPFAEAQNFGQRVIQGKVLDESDAAVAGATVYLENLKNRDVKTFSSTGDGSFRFAQVGMIDDYEVWAEKGKKKSAVKTISSFDSRKEVDFDLKLK
jgi:hypothetical protein